VIRLGDDGACPAASRDGRAGGASDGRADEGEDGDGGLHFDGCWCFVFVLVMMSERNVGE
jgi:hypothetical protein